MPNKKRKKTSISPKLQKAQKFNDFKNRLLLIAKACNAHEEFKLLPKVELEILFATRFLPFDIIAADGQSLSSANYKILKETVNFYLKQKKITFIPNGPEVNLYDYCYVGEPLRCCLREISFLKFKGVDDIINAFKPFSDIAQGPNDPRLLLFEIAITMSSMLSRVNSGYWLFHFHMISQVQPVPKFKTCFKVEFVAPQKMFLTENGNKRPIYRVGFTENGNCHEWAQVTPQKLEIDSAFENLKIDVYIQSHALNRLKERLDIWPDFIIQYLLFKNVSWCNIVKNRKQQSLIQFSTGKHKLGYLVYEYIKGVVVIKTFLLLTNNDTPEGEMLQELLKLEKKDKSYLDLDMLSHFVRSDIPSNTVLYKYFKDAGCTDLFEIDEKLIGNDIQDNMHAELIEQYVSSYDTESV